MAGMRLGGIDPSILRELSGVYKPFVKAFKDKFSTDPDQFASQSYTAMIVLADAMKRASSPTDKAALKKALEGANLATPLGQFSFTADHDVKQPVFVMTVKDGAFVPFN